MEMSPVLCRVSQTSVSCLLLFFFKQKTAYEMRISDWSSDVCSSDLQRRGLGIHCRKPGQIRPKAAMSPRRIGEQRMHSWMTRLSAASAALTLAADRKSGV